MDGLDEKGCRFSTTIIVVRKTMVKQSCSTQTRPLVLQ